MAYLSFGANIMSLGPNNKQLLALKFGNLHTTIKKYHNLSFESQILTYIPVTNNAHVEPRFVL